MCSPAAAQTVDPPPIGAVFREVPRDLWHFLSWDTAAVLGIGGGAALIGHIWDDDLADEVETNVQLNAAMDPGHTYGAFSFQVVVGIGLYTVGWFGNKGGLARTGGDIMRAQLVSQLYVQGIKFSTQRTRPDDVGVSVAYPLPGTPFHELVRSQLGEKRNWRESSDLEMMFAGTYRTEFYRAVRDLLHDQVAERPPTGSRGGECCR